MQLRQVVIHSPSTSAEQDLFDALKHAREGLLRALRETPEEVGAPQRDKWLRNAIEACNDAVRRHHLEFPKPLPAPPSFLVPSKPKQVWRLIKVWRS